MHDDAHAGDPGPSRSGRGFGLLTTDELAAELGVTSRALKDWRANRVGPPFLSINRGSRIFYRREAVERWLAEQEIKPVGGRRAGNRTRAA